jgi:serine phosphatase RsbU (regulator of sigma subunit)
MQAAPPFSDEMARLEALKEYEILDTPPEAEFDDFTWLASEICGTPIALISLLDADRQWFKSKVGLDASETPRELTFCAHAIHGQDILEVPNALEDERFADNPLVTGAPDIRFYAGSPLITPVGMPLGTLCVIDRVPRQLSEQQRESLSRLGRQVVVQLELRLAKRKLQRLALKLEDANCELRRSNEKLAADLTMAREFQLALLPAAHPDFPPDGPAGQLGLHFSHQYEASAEVGGDFYGILTLSDTQAGVFQCDVMGHGVRAALVVAIIRGLVEELKPVALDPGRFITEMNHALAEVLRDTDTDMYATAFYMVVDIGRGCMVCTNAGHPRPFHANRNRGTVKPLHFEKGVAGPVLGLLKESSYGTMECPLAVGDTIVLYTDGVIEATAPDGEEYGEQRLSAAIGTRLELPTERIFEEILADARRFCATGSFGDDVCLVGVDVCRALGRDSGSTHH